MSPSIPPLLAPASRRVWVDAAAYGARLFGRGARYPADVAGILAVHSQVQRLLGSDAIFVSMGDVFDAVLRDDPRLTSELVGKRPTATARKILGAEVPARVLAEVLAGCTRLPELSKPLLLLVPSPRGWLGRAAELGHGGDQGAPSLDDVDSVAVYLADALRGVASVPLAGVVLGDGRSAPLTREEREVMPPLVNVARHYRWMVGVHLASGEVEDPSSLDEVDFVVDASSGAAELARHRARWQARGRTCIGGLPRDFWTDASAPAPDGDGVWFGTIPETAEPEQVLAKMRALRSS